MAAAFKACAVAGCNGKSRARGYCVAHYKRWARHGDPLAGGTPMGARQAWIDEHKNYSGEDCLVWPFGRTVSGYGQFRVDGRSTLASHGMCRAAHGSPPTPLHQAAHSCGNGNKGCVNPRHLRWATRLENEADKIIHGTLARGERQGSSKLTSEDVRAIRSIAGKRSHHQIARDFGVARSQIGRIINRERWAWLA